MTTEEMKEQAIGLKKRYDAWTPGDKAVLRALVKELGIIHKFNTRCNSCHRDAFHLVVNALGMKSADFACKKDKGSKYIFTGKKEAVWHGPYGAVTLDEFTPDEMVDKFIEAVSGTQDCYALKPLEENEGQTSEQQLLLG